MGALQERRQNSCQKRDVDMITACIFVLIGLSIAFILDWAIYTHLSAFLRVGLALSMHVRYRDLTLTRWHKVRLVFVAMAGAAGGISFAIHDPVLWIFAVTGFLLGHSLIYASLAKK
jgi:hypothetical protein